MFTGIVQSQAKVISIKPSEFWNEEFQENDQIIDRHQIEDATKNWSGEKTLIIRTLENNSTKIHQQYSNSNPTYLTKGAIDLINQLKVDHLMVDVPSLDRELDNGLLIAHKAFWNYPENPQTHKTISELLYVPNILKDGTYIIQIQIMSIESDASPSKIMAHIIHQD